MQKLLAILVSVGTIGLSTPAFAEKSIDRDAQPIYPPHPTYPEQAAREGLIGACDVTFNVSIDGHPQDIIAACTHHYFCQSSAEAMSRVEFAPKQINGIKATRSNVVYPIIYSMMDDNGKPLDVDPNIPQSPCS